MKSQKYRKGIFVVVYTLDKDNSPLYLILKRKLHWSGYEFPKGGKNFLESNLHAVKRELLEETGLIPLRIHNHRIHGKYKYKKELSDREGVIGQTYTLYSARVNKEKIKLDEREHFSFDWLPFEKAHFRLTHSNQKDCLRMINVWIKQRY
jgi:8-oxo-dGTP pyrophosphatase MutT (NUDIX family)